MTNDAIICRCKSWGCEDMRKLFLGNGHHPGCELFQENVGAMELLAELCKGIEEWAAEEDGVPDWVWPAYRKAKYLTSGKLLSETKP